MIPKQLKRLFSVLQSSFGRNAKTSFIKVNHWKSRLHVQKNSLRNQVKDLSCCLIMVTIACQAERVMT